MTPFELAAALKAARMKTPAKAAMAPSVASSGGGHTKVVADTPKALVADKTDLALPDRGAAKPRSADRHKPRLDYNRALRAKHRAAKPKP